MQAEPPAAEEDLPPSPVTADGPDPRSWPDISGGHDGPSVWDLVLDIEVLERTTKALVGSSEPQAGPAYGQARDFLATALHQRKGLLAAVLLSTYGIALDGEAGEGPFAHAGKARAYGSAVPPPGNV